MDFPITVTLFLFPSKSYPWNISGSDVPEHAFRDNLWLREHRSSH